MEMNQMAANDVRQRLQQYDPTHVAAATREFVDRIYKIQKERGDDAAVQQARQDFRKELQPLVRNYRILASKGEEINSVLVTAKQQQQGDTLLKVDAEAIRKLQRLLFDVSPIEEFHKDLQKMEKSIQELTALQAQLTTLKSSYQSRLAYAGYCIEWSESPTLWSGLASNFSSNEWYLTKVLKLDSTS
jgi:hypothetical protein